jgi:hypothetical protein
MSIPFEINTSQFVKKNTNATLNNLVCEDLSVNGTLTYKDSEVIADKTINGDLTVYGDSSLNNLFVRGVLRPEAQILDGNILGNDQNIVGLSRLEADDISASTLFFAKQGGINVENDEAYTSGNNVLRIAGHTNITNFTDDMTEQKSAQLVLGKVSSDQYIKFKTQKTGTGLGASSIDFKNINTEANASLDYLGFKNDDTLVGYINNVGKLRMKQLEVKIDSNDGTYMNFRDNAGDTNANDVLTIKSGIDSGEFPSAHFVDFSMCGDYSSNPSEIFMSTDKTKASYIDCSFVGINTRTPEGDLHISTSGQDYIFNDKQLYFRGDPTTNTDTGSEKRRIVADSIGGNVLFKLLNRLGTTNTESAEIFDGNMTRGASFGVENSSYKGTRFIASHPSISADNDSQNAFSFKMYGDTSSSPTGEIDMLYDGSLHLEVDGGHDYQFKSNEMVMGQNPVTSGTQEQRRITANYGGINVNMKMMCSFDDDNFTKTCDVFANNVERTSNNIKIENNNYKGVRIESLLHSRTDADTNRAIMFHALGNNSSNNPTGELIFHYDGDLEINGTYTPSSDEKLKENIVDANTTSLVSDFQKIRFVNFNMIRDERKLKKLGVIAQNIKEIYPSCVVERTIMDNSSNVIDSYLSVKYEVLYLKSCLLVQHLLKENESLKTRVTNLESQVNLNNAMITNLTNTINSSNTTIN